MKIYIDISVLTLATFVTGIQRVTREIALHLIGRRGDDIVLLHYHAGENSYHRIDNRKFCDFYLRGKGVKNRMITSRQVPLAEIGEGCIFFDLDAAWMSRVKRSWLLPVLKSQGARIVAHIYDIISVTHPQYCLQRGVYHFMDYIGAHLLYADELIVNAAATVEELRKLSSAVGVAMPECRVIPLGADFGSREKEPGSRRQTDGGGQIPGEGSISEDRKPEELPESLGSAPYLLMVGTIEPRKNHKLLLEAYEIGLRELGYHIVFAGYMGWNMEEFAEKLRAHPDYGKRVFHLEGLNDRAIRYLYRHAEFLVFCSYTEGFGLPLIEGICRGTPVLAADIPVSREVAGDHCLWFRQDVPEDICRIAREYRDDREKYMAWKASLASYHPMSWEECGKRMEEALLI